MGSFHLHDRDRPREKLLLPAMGPFKLVQETGKSASYSLCSYLCCWEAEVQSTVASRADKEEGPSKYQGKSPSHHALNFWSSGDYQGSSGAHPCCWLLTLQLYWPSSSVCPPQWAWVKRSSGSILKKLAENEPVFPAKLHWFSKQPGSKNTQCSQCV